MLTPVKKNSIAYEVADRIIAAILSGQLKPGDRLDSERNMAIAFQVSRTSVREAIKMLSFNKIVESRPGAGTFVLDTPLNLQKEDVIKENGVINNPLVQSLEMRMIVEPKIIRLAAVHITDEELAEFDEILAEMENAAKSNEYGAYSLLDLRYHYHCAKASKNPDLYDMLRKYCGSPQHVASFGQTPNVELVTFEQHKQMVEHLRNHDADAAEKLMNEHILFAFKKSTSDQEFAIYSDRMRLIAGDMLE